MSLSPRRKSRSGLLRRPSLGPLTLLHDDPDKAYSSKTQKKSKPSLLFSHTSAASAPAKENTAAGSTETLLTPSTSNSNRPSILRKGRPSSIFGSLKTFRANDDDTPPATASSGRAPSLNWKDFGLHTDTVDIGRDRKVLHHGEAQTNAAVFFKKKEYLVLTEFYLVRFKSQSKAADTFSSISHPFPNRAGISRHASSPSAGSSKNGPPSNISETSGDKASAISLEQVVAVYAPDDARNHPLLEIAYLDNEAGQGTTLTLQFIDSDEVELWKRSIRYAADRLRFTNFDPIPTKLSEYAARVVERAKDYDINTYRIYKVVKRNNLRNVSRSSVDDFHKASPTVCFLAIGTHLVHIIALPKHLRVSTPTLSEVHEGDSFGILSLTGVQVNENDDNFSLSFRLPFQDTCVLHLASLASCEIALRLRQVENFLRPGWLARPYFFDLPAKVEDNFIADDPPPDDGFESFDRTMIAYCVAYGVNPISIRYRVDDGEQVEDAPRFQLLEPEAGTIRGYTPQQLLAIFRSLRFNEAFGTISFAGISLDCINGIGDRFGAEHLPSHSVHVTPFGMSPAEQHEASLLVQEIRALAISTTALRRLDFSFCISKPDSKMPTFAGRSTAVGCGAVEALFPLCKQQATNVDWIALNGIELQETDLDYLVSIAAEKAAHFRAVEASRCGLTDRGIALLLDVFKAHQNTLEALDISSNTLRLAPMILSSQLGVFGHIRKLNLSNLAVTSTTEPLIPLEILSQWRLDTLHLSGIPLNEETLEVLCNYVGLFQSLTLRELWLCNCNLNGDEAAGIMQALSHEEGAARFCHLNLGENPLATKPDKMASAIAKSQCPTQLSLRSIEYDLQDVFEELLLAFAANKSIRSLDIARTSLPGEAGEGVCKAMEKLLADNNTLIDIDISGEESRLETSKLGMGINEALNGLKTNGSLQVLRVQLQKLGMQGASTLADVLKANKTLRELHCDFNAITLPGFTDLVNSLAENTTILFLPPFSESRYAALRQTEEQIRIARTKTDETMMGSSSSKISSVRRTFSTLGAGIAPSQFGSSKSSSSRVGAVPQWTEQDVQAALRLVNEGWEDQARRLNQYLARNWRILHGVEDITSGTVSEGEKDQRPGTAGSIGKVLQKVASQSTPTMEKDAQLVLEEDARPSEARSATDSPEAVEQEQNSPQHAQFGDLPIDDAHFLRQNIFEPGSPNMSPTSPLSPPYLMAEEQRHERESSGDDESSGNDVDDFHDARSKKESDESGKSEQ